MLTAISDERAIRVAYHTLEQAIWNGHDQPICTIWHHGRTTPEPVVWHDKHGFWVSLRPERQGNRYWCAYGIVNPRQSQSVPITCECNPSKTGADRRCGGLFAANDDGNVWLCHSGRIKDHKDAILRHWKRKYGLIEVSFRRPNQTEVHEYIVIGNIRSPSFLSDLSKFVHAVAKVKNVSA